MRPDDVMLIGDIAARTGLSVSAIRFYEAKGLITPIRSPGGQRRFRRADIRRLSFIRIAQQLGLSIESIAGELAKLPSGRTPTAADWTRISRSIRASLDARIATLQQVRSRLDEPGADRAHGAVVGGKGLIELGHVAADGRLLFH